MTSQNITKQIISTTLFIISVIIAVILFTYRESLIPFLVHDDNPTLEINSESKIIANELFKLPEDNIQILKEDSVEEHQTSKEKIEKIKKRFSLKWIILKWDYFIENQQPLKGLSKYIQALRKNPKDEEIIHKIADTYFELKKFDKAFNYYFRLKEYPQLNKYNTILSMIYSKNLLNKNDVLYSWKIVNALKLRWHERFYFLNALYCLIDFHACKIKYNEFFLTQNTRINGLIDIKKAIEKYKKFKSWNIYYKDALIAWAFYAHKLYPLSIIIWEKIIKTRPNYIPMLLIIWKSYFELWDYEKANKYLLKYYELNQSDEKISYLLWTINYLLKDYISSNLYFNVAIENGYQPKTQLERKLVYNYYLLDDHKEMIKVFSYLLKEEDVEIEDYVLAIYHAIVNKKTSKALEWIGEGFQKFPDEEIFYGYLWWIYREQESFELAEEKLTKWLAMNSRNPLITLNMWYLLEKQEKFNKALLFFKRTVSANKEWEFWELAQKEIKIIEDYLNEE